MKSVIILPSPRRDGSISTNVRKTKLKTWSWSWSGSRLKELRSMINFWSRSLSPNRPPDPRINRKKSDFICCVAIYTIIANLAWSQLYFYTFKEANCRYDRSKPKAHSRDSEDNGRWILDKWGNKVNVAILMWEDTRLQDTAVPQMLLHQVERLWE